MYTYNLHWGLSLVASGEATGSTILCSPHLAHPFPHSHLFSHSFIHSSDLSSSASFSIFPGPKGWFGREMVPRERRFNSSPSLSSLLSSRNSWFLVYSLKSFVFFGRVSDTLVCLGNRLGKGGALKDCGSRAWTYMRGCMADEGKERRTWTSSIIICWTDWKIPTLSAVVGQLAVIFYFIKMRP